MASIVEALGMSMPGHCSHVAVNEDNTPTERKRQDCAETVAATFALMRAVCSPFAINLSAWIYAVRIPYDYAVGGESA